MSQVKPIEQIKTGNVNVKTGEEESIYNSIYMQVVKIVEDGSVNCSRYKDTVNKLKDLYFIEKRSEKQSAPDQSSQIKLLQEQIRKQEEEVYMLRESLNGVKGKCLYQPCEGCSNTCEYFSPFFWSEQDINAVSINSIHCQCPNCKSNFDIDPPKGIYMIKSKGYLTPKKP